MVTLGRSTEESYLFEVKGKCLKIHTSVKKMFDSMHRISPMGYGTKNGYISRTNSLIVY